MNKKFALGITVLTFLLIIIIWGRSSTNFSFEFKSNDLSKIINENLPGNNGQYAVYIEDLSDGENYSLRSLDSFPAASLYKLFLLAAALKEIEDGNLEIEDQLSISKQELINSLGEDEFGIEDLPNQVEFSIQEALERVGRISDNFAAIMLGNKIGWEKVQNMANNLGAKNTSVKDPIQTSTEDIALFFKKLYLKEIASVKVSQDLEKYLSLSRLNDRIPAGLPEGVKVIHKTGELSGVRHDAGVVYLTDKTNGSNKTYLIVLMSKNLQYEDKGVETLARISKEVYEYFKNKSGPTGN